MVGISTDSPADNKAFRDKFAFPYDLLSDEDKSMSIAYAQVTPAEHPGQVLADLDRLG